MQLIAALYDASSAPLFDARRVSVDRDLYPDISLMLGVRPVNVVDDKYRQRIGRDLAAVPWPMVFQFVIEMFRRLAQHGRSDLFRDSVNRIFAMHGIAWDLGADGNLHRVLPQPAAAAIQDLFTELREARFDGARRLAEAAQRHFDARPREDRDACSNIFDAMEEAAKVALNLPGRPFGDVLDEIRRRNIAPGLRDVLDKLNGMAHQTFRHGNNVVLPPEVVDFIYIACVGGTAMFARLG